MEVTNGKPYFDTFNFILSSRFFRMNYMGHLHSHLSTVTAWCLFCRICGLWKFKNKTQPLVVFFSYMKIKAHCGLVQFYYFTFTMETILNKAATILATSTVRKTNPDWMQICCNFHPHSTSSSYRDSMSCKESKQMELASGLSPMSECFPDAIQHIPDSTVILGCGK